MKRRRHAVGHRRHRSADQAAEPKPSPNSGFVTLALTLAADERMALSRSQRPRDFATRLHHTGRHAVDISVNGETLAGGFLTLVF